MSDQGHPSWMPPPAPPPGGWPYQPPYGAAPGPPPHPGWYGPGGYPRPGDTNGFAIASLVCSLLGIIFLLVGPALAIVFGIVGLKQIPRLGQGGRGLAVAGITIGAIVLALDVIGLVAAFATSSVGGSGGVPV